MVKAQTVFSGMSVNDLDKAKKFYIEIMGLELANDDMGLSFKLPGGGQLFIYPKDDHQPASYTVLNWVVDDIDKAVDELSAQGVKFERYEGFEVDDKGIARGLAAGKGPDIAWFTDPAGNILAVLQDE